MELKTPLYDIHVQSGGKIVPFAGYSLPVQYKEGIISEHMAVRTKAGLFDVSHMGEIVLSGKDALNNIQNLMTNDFDSMQVGKTRYTLMCNHEGGIVDDLLVYKMDDEKYMLVVNAANRQKDAEWIKKHLYGEVEFKDISDDIAQIALQGPNSNEILKKLAQDQHIPQKYYSFIENGIVAGFKCIVSRTGYTGEDGFELYCKSEAAPALWKELIKAGEAFGLVPCGLGARDTLRLEAGMPLYGNEMSEEITPKEVGLSFFVKMNKSDFIGKSALEQKGGPTRKRVGLKPLKGIAREGSKIFIDGQEIGFTTSGTFAPYLRYPVAMALIDKKYAEIGTKVEVDVRGRMLSAEVIELPFYKRG